MAMRIGDRVRFRNGVRGLSNEPQKDKVGLLREIRVPQIEDIAEDRYLVHFGEGDSDNGWYPQSSVELA